MSNSIAFTTGPTRLGVVAVAWTARGVCGLRLPARSAAAAERALRARFPDAVRGAPTPALAGVLEGIVRYFDGERVAFSSVALDLEPPDPFVAAVYAHVRTLGWGETTTYGAVAKALGAAPMAARDVGVAMATNPVPLIVPCHRVLAAGGKIGGFSAPGGSATKARMLEIEGVAPAPQRGGAPAAGPPAQPGFVFEDAPAPSGQRSA